MNRSIEIRDHRAMGVDYSWECEGLVTLKRGRRATGLLILIVQAARITGVFSAARLIGEFMPS